MERILPYFSFRGRLSRLAYWRIQLMAVCSVAAILLIAAGVPLAGLLFVAILPAALASTAASARRLHDRGKGTNWLVLFMVGPSVVTRFSGSLFAVPGLAWLGVIGSLAALGLWAWAFVEIGLRGGEPGPNRFGDNPLRSTAEVFA